MEAAINRPARPRCRFEAGQPGWRDHLPEEWRDCVVAPLRFEHHREYEMPAARCFGFDEDDAACYYAHAYTLTELRSDDDEEYYEVPSYRETVRAWRLRDERWLIYRHLKSGDDCSPGQEFYSFSATPPR